LYYRIGVEIAHETPASRSRAVTTVGTSNAVMLSPQPGPDNLHIRTSGSSLLLHREVTVMPHPPWCSRWPRSRSPSVTLRRAAGNAAV